MKAELKQEREELKVGFTFDLWPTGTCDMDCPFTCYGSAVPVLQKASGNGRRGYIKKYIPTAETIAITGDDLARPEMTEDQVKHVLTVLHNAGGNKTVFAGGEPLIRKETPEFIKYAKRMGLIVYLSTNGSFVSKRYPEFFQHIDVLGLPLDGSSTEMNTQMGRREYCMGNTLELLRMFKKNKPPHKVKIGTVLSRVNVSDLENIAALLFENPDIRPPDIWRIYQFEEIGRGIIGAESHKIDDDQFIEATERVQRLYPGSGIFPRSNETHINAYFFVTPDGMIQVVNEHSHVSIGDLLTLDQNGVNMLIENYQETVQNVNNNRAWLYNTDIPKPAQL
jgi:organic radical activating enzyme